MNLNLDLDLNLDPDLDLNLDLDLNQSQNLDLDLNLNQTLPSTLPPTRTLCLHLPGGDATVSQADDREQGDHLDGEPLRLVLRVRLQCLRAALPHRHRPPHPLHATDAPQPVGDLHGC